MELTRGCGQVDSVAHPHDLAAAPIGLTGVCVLSGSEGLNATNAAESAFAYLVISSISCWVVVSGN